MSSIRLVPRSTVRRPRRGTREDDAHEAHVDTSSSDPGHAVPAMARDVCSRSAAGHRTGPSIVSAGSSVSDAPAFPDLENRVGVLLSRMTLDEKLGNVAGSPSGQDRRPVQGRDSPRPLGSLFNGGRSRRKQSSSGSPARRAGWEFRSSSART